MTKEEILFPLHTHCDEELEMMYTHESAMKAMDEFAKEQSIALLEWMTSEGFEDIMADHKNTLTPEITVDLFLSHKSSLKQLP